jgi:uncharacterized OB-fold protein
MTVEWRHQTIPLIHSGGIHMPYSWTVGRVGSRFFIELRDNGRLMANRCKVCNVVWVPPRSRCPECFEEIKDNDWLEVGPIGTLRYFTIIWYEHPAQPIKPPFAYGLIDLDNADRGIVHFVAGTDLKKLKPGLRVRPVLKPDRKGSILDILYFTPVEGGE